MADYNRHTSQKAIRILEWTACSYRTLKLYEIQDGVVFTRENHELNVNTKQSVSIIELCKPLLEEGPGSTVEFVHYSAKEYPSYRIGTSRLSADKLQGIYYIKSADRSRMNKAGSSTPTPNPLPPFT